uniref:Uncharacterized protein n=1 Tax=Arundo donax TaxID=35708 RepID=A0A0A9C107_ARUDO
MSWVLPSGLEPFLSIDRLRPGASS